MTLPQDDSQDAVGHQSWASREQAAATSWMNQRQHINNNPQFSSDQPSEAFPSFEGFESGTDTDTSSDEEGEWGPEQYSLNPEEIEAYAQDLYWAYSKAKRQWRSFMGKPRKVRRFLRKSFKGKGKVRASLKALRVKQARSLALRTCRSCQIMRSSHSSQPPRRRGGTGVRAQGRGRKANPRGRDGKPMQCHDCGSTERLIAKCPRRQQSQSSGPNSLFVYANELSAHPQVQLLSTNPPGYQPEAGVIHSTSV